MPNKSSPEKQASDILKIAVEALKLHENRLDRATTKLEEKKDDLTTNLRETSNNLEHMLQQLIAVEEEIKQLKQLIGPH